MINTHVNLAYKRSASNQHGKNELLNIWLSHQVDNNLRKKKLDPYLASHK